MSLWISYRTVNMVNKCWDKTRSVSQKGKYHSIVCDREFFTGLTKKLVQDFFSGMVSKFAFMYKKSFKNYIKPISILL